jgi:hypothetical protein
MGVFNVRRCKKREQNFGSTFEKGGFPKVGWSKRGVFKPPCGAKWRSLSRREQQHEVMGRGFAPVWSKNLIN